MAGEAGDEPGDPVEPGLRGLVVPVGELDDGDAHPAILPHPWADQPSRSASSRSRASRSL